MHLLVINFKAENTAEEYDKATAEIAPVFAEIEGLIIKHFLFNHEEKTYGGCYQFESKAALDAFMGRRRIQDDYGKSRLVRPYGKKLRSSCRSY